MAAYALRESPSYTGQKERGRHEAGPSPIIRCEAIDYPLVTTGGGVVVQPATLRRVSTAASAIAAFFIRYSPCLVTRQNISAEESTL